MAHPDDLASRARAEKYAKIIAKTVVTSSSGTEHGQNSYFYDAAEGLITSVILLVAEFCPPETRHIVSVFKLIFSTSSFEMSEQVFCAKIANG